jgi:hypothetical protein
LLVSEAKVPAPKSKLHPVTPEALEAYQRMHEVAAGPLPEVGTDRWLWSNGIIAESIQQNLLAYGWLAHPTAKDVEVVVPENADQESRFIGFKVWITPRDLRSYLRYKKRIRRLARYSWLPLRWLLVKILERGQAIDVDRNVRRMVRDYLGEKVLVKVEVLPWEG